MNNPAFDDLYDQLVRTRARYEELRAADGAFDERSRMRSNLQAIRADLAAIRSGR